MFTKITRITCCMLSLWAASASANTVTDWNARAVSCITRAGPTAILDLALVQAAVHDAIQAIERNYEPYLATPIASGTESVAAAAAGAAYTVLSDNRICPDSVQADLDTAVAPFQGTPGYSVGVAAGNVLLGDYRPIPALPPFLGGTEIGQWRPTAPSNLPMAFVYFATTRPFTLKDPTQFLPEPPPPMQSKTYAREYDEVKTVGSIASHPATASCPSPDLTDMARFWSGNFVAQWNAVARALAVTRGLSEGQSARLLALANMAAADAGIAVWNSKLHYNFWRPVTAIHFGDSDPNASTVGDTTWVPFINSTTHFPTTPASQNPPYPDYVSGANGLTGSFVATLQLFFGTDEMAFTVPKATPAAVLNCTNPRSFQRFSDAAQEVVEARIYLGIHFRSADVAARRLGERVSHWTFQKALRAKN